MMISTDRDALACDMAETYHIIDWRGLPASRLAVLACGLRVDARIWESIRNLPDPSAPAGFDTPEDFMTEWRRVNGN